MHNKAGVKSVLAKAKEIGFEISSWIGSEGNDFATHILSQAAPWDVIVDDMVNQAQSIYIQRDLANQGCQLHIKESKEGDIDITAEWSRLVSKEFSSIDQTKIPYVSEYIDILLQEINPNSTKGKIVDAGYQRHSVVASWTQKEPPRNDVTNSDPSTPLISQPNSVCCSVM